MENKGYSLTLIINGAADGCHDKSVNSVSRTSAEDTARRFFRKHGVPMGDVVKSGTDRGGVWAYFGKGSDEPKPAPEPIDPTAIDHDTLQAMAEALWDRWQDEREYEDWVGYVRAAREQVEKQGLRFVGLSKRPFALRYADGGSQWKIKVTASASYVSQEA